MNRAKITLITSLLSVLWTLSVFGEGTKQLTPNFGDNGFLQIFARSSTAQIFATYLAGPEQRLYFTVCDTSERVFIGMRQNDGDVYVRIKDPNDNVIFGPVLIPAAGDGFINTYNEAVSGPQEIVGLGGYDGLEIDPQIAGDYYIEFNPVTPDYQNEATNAVRRVLQYFDLTVTDQNDNIIEGRLWSREWDITCESFENRFQGTMFVYSNDSIVTSIDFNGIQPFYFTISCNLFGLENTGSAFLDRQSRDGNITSPSYRIFLNDPDSNCYPTGRFGALTGDLSISGCDPFNRTIHVPVDKAGSASIILDLNGIPGYQPGTSDRIISLELVAGNNEIPWDGLDGLGNPVVGTGTIPVQLDYFNGLTHLPIYDVENHENGFTVELIRPSGPRPQLFWDDSRIPDGTIELTGCDDPNGCHSWSDNNPSFHWGDRRTINTWWYANILRDSAEFQNQQVITATGHFTSISNGGDTTVCSSENTIDLIGEISGATGGIWSSSGTGSFAPNDTTLTNVYNFTAADKTQDSINFFLETTGNGNNCTASFDTISLRFAEPPTIVTSNDTALCANNAIFSLNAGFTNATGITWTGGSGNITPNDSSLSILYQPTDAEISSGSIILTATTRGQVYCPAVNSSTTLSILDEPTIDAGNNISVCTDNPTVTLSGSFSNSSGAYWSGGLGTFSDSTDMNATYTPDPSEVIAGDSLVLTLHSIDALCLEVTDQMAILFTGPATVSAGNSQIVCEDVTSVQLDGSFTNAGFAQWSGNGTFLPNDTTMDATYGPTQAEINQGFADVILTSQDNGTCNQTSDTVRITFAPEPEALAGNNQFICSNNAIATINGSANNSNNPSWSGAGTFFPGNTSLNITYIPTQSEITNGVAILILNAPGTNGCPSDADTMRVVIAPPPTVDAGLDDTVCANNPLVNLSGSLTNGTSQFWTGGNGTFSPNPPINTDVDYTPTQTEIDNGVVQLYFQGVRSGCLNVIDTVNVYFSAIPEVDAGADLTACENHPDFSLQGSVIRATGGTWSNGSGTFSPSPNDLVTTYTASDAEVTAGSVDLILTTTGNGNCLAVADTVNLSFTPAPTIDAGNNTSVCANVLPDSLTATFTIAGGVQWSGGSENFGPSNQSNPVLYTPSAADTATGSVTLYATTTDTLNCRAVSDSIIITFTPAPVAIAGDTITICLDNPTAQLNASTTIATGGVWTGGNGTYNPHDSSLTATYTPSPDEIAARTLTLTLNTIDNQGCNAVTDEVVINMVEIPVALPGNDMVVCSNSGGFPLSGQVFNAGGGIWTTSGSGSFSPNDSSLNVTYTPSAPDIAMDSIYITLTTTQNGLCGAVDDSIKIVFQPAPSIDAGDDQTVCTNDLPVQLNGTGSPAQWSGGTGTFSPSPLALNATYMPSSADTLAGSVRLFLITFPDGSCSSIQDTVDITILNGPRADAGSDQTVCADADSVFLGGTIINAGGATWTSTGNGNFSPNDTDLNGTYLFTQDDIDDGTIFLLLTTDNHAPCPASVDSLELTITPAPTVFAGPNQEFCSDEDSIQLDGQVTIASGGIWTTTGSGSFTDSTDLNGFYLPSPADTLAGSITITLTTSGSGNCQDLSHTMTISFTPTPTVAAGNNFAVCADTNFFNLNGAVTIATGGIWNTSGTGIFSANNVSLNTNYFPSAADTAAGQVQFFLTSTGNGTCNAVTDTITVTIDPAPVVDAGPDFNICADSSGTPLSGTVLNASGGTWTSSGSGTFSPSTDSLDTFYNITQGDINNGFVSFTLTSTGNGLCNEVSDQVIALIGPAPEVDAGLDRTVCASEDSVILNGGISNAGGGEWSSDGTGTFIDINDLNTYYLPSVNDVTNGSATIYLTSINNGNCKATPDTVVLFFDPIPAVDAGNDVTVCADTTSISLNASSSNTQGISWSTLGSGSFFPSTIFPLTQYVPSTTDIANGSVEIVLSSVGTGQCPTVTDTINILINPEPTVDAGDDVIVCADTSFINLSGIVTIATGGIWSSNGSGTFSDSTDLNATYTPSAVDTATRSVVLTLTTTGNDLCNAVSDQVLLTILPAPILNTPGNIIICEDSSLVPLNSSFANAGGVSWNSDGNGIFSPNSSSVDAGYIPSGDDINSGTVLLTVQTTDNGLCRAITDSIRLDIDALPVVNAGDDTEICADLNGVAIFGDVQNATGLIWTSSGTGNFFPNSTTANATYSPSQADVDSGGVVLHLSSQGSGGCPDASDSIELTIRPLPSVDAGPDIEVCEGFDLIQLNPVISNVDSVSWTSSGIGTFTDSTQFDAIYNGGDPAGSIVTLTLTSTSAGTCAPTTDRLILTVMPEVVVDAGPDQIMCPDNDTLFLNGTVLNAGGAHWQSAGNGIFTPSEDSAVTGYIPTADDRNFDTLFLQLSATNVGVCNAAHDIIAVTFADILVIDAGPDSITVCTNDLPVRLEGTGSAGIWSGGLGSYSPNNTSLNADYSPDTSEIVSGSVVLTLSSINNGSCNAVSDSVRIIIETGPTVFAGDDVAVCADTSGIELNGIITVASGGFWSTSGTGTFTPDTNSLNIVYTLSNADIVDSLVTLVLTSTGNGNCNAVSDAVNISISPAPSIDAGFDQSLCADRDTVDLTGFRSVLNASRWSVLNGGDGSFIPNDTSLSVSYLIGSGDSTNGGVSILISSIDHGLCKPVYDTVDITITPTVVATITPLPQICEDADEIDLDATLQVANGIEWTSTGDGFFIPSNTVEDPTYVLSDNDKANGEVTFNIRSIDNGDCQERQDSLNLIINPAPEVDAGEDQMVCINTSGIDLNGSVSIADGVLWTSSGSGNFSDNDTILAPTYIPSQADIQTGGVTITISSTGNGLCPAATDIMTIFINDEFDVQANAGLDQIVCADVSSITLNGTVNDAQGGLWTTINGTGSFSPGDDVLSTNYIPSSQDLSSGLLAFILETTGTDFCETEYDTINVIITPAPSIFAGDDTTICADVSSIDLNGTVNIALGGSWVSSSGGDFSPSANILNPAYIISDEDKANGLVSLIITSTGNGTCNPVSDDLLVTITEAPTIIASPDQTVCANIGEATVSASIATVVVIYSSTLKKALPTPFASRTPEISMPRMFAS